MTPSLRASRQDALRRLILAVSLSLFTACAWFQPAGPSLVTLPEPMQDLRLPLAGAELTSEAGGVTFTVEGEDVTAAKLHARLSATLVAQGWEPVSRDRIPRGLTSRWVHPDSPRTIGLLVGGGKGKVSGLVSYTDK